jgi:arginyl-tRNA synthetase
MVSLAEDIQKLINGAWDAVRLRQNYLPEAVTLFFRVERPSVKIFGDYSTNIAIIAAHAIKTVSPPDLAKEIAEELRAQKSAFEKIEVVGGFINIFLAPSFVGPKHDEFARIVQKRSRTLMSVGAGKRVNIEFLSSNPTGEPHVGNARSAFFGDVLGNMYAACGYDVDKEFYVNDALSSGQIAELGKTALGAGETYRSEYLDRIVRVIKKTKKLKELARATDESTRYAKVGFLVAQAVVKDLKYFVRHAMHIKYDLWFSEHTLHTKGSIENVLSQLEHSQEGKELTYQKEGALWLRTSALGDDEDRVLRRSNGSPTYFAADIAYHKNKIERGYDTIIDVWGADHHGHKKRMEIVMRMLGFHGAFKVCIAQMVSLKVGGKRTKLSKREGTIITVKELLREVPLDVVRIFYLTKSLDTHLDFDLALAKEQSNKNPVYYVQYAYARICNIIKEGKKKCGKLPPAMSEGPEAAAKERELMLKHLQLFEVLPTALEKQEPHLLFLYAHQLAETFHSFYGSCKVLHGDAAIRQRRLALIATTQSIFEQLFHIFGVSAPKKM